MDAGDFIVVVNAEKVKLTGRKWIRRPLSAQRHRRHHRHGGKRQLQLKPEELLRTAVRGMLPKNRLGRQLLKKMKVYAGPTHPHQAQQPQPLAL
ncbi:large subunit ribosomal protein L13 [Desulfarculales bacterium]